MLQITLQIYVLACVFTDMLEVYLKIVYLKYTLNILHVQYTSIYLLIILPEKYISSILLR